MSNGIMILVGIVIGVFIASNSPEAAEQIRATSMELIYFVKGLLK